MPPIGLGADVYNLIDAEIAWKVRAGRSIMVCESKWELYRVSVGNTCNPPILLVMWIDLQLNVQHCKCHYSKQPSSNAMLTCFQLRTSRLLARPAPLSFRSPNHEQELLCVTLC